MQYTISKEAKIAVLCGGMSSEREVSLRSGKNILAALKRLGYANAEIVDVSENIMNDLILGILFSLIAGIMLQISFCELLPTARRYNNTKYLIIFFLIGVLFMLMKFIL